MYMPEAAGDPVLGSLPLTQETWIKLPAPGFGVAVSWLWVVKQQMGGLSISLFVFFCSVDSKLSD